MIGNDSCQESLARPWVPGKERPFTGTSPEFDSAFLRCKEILMKSLTLILSSSYPAKSSYDGPFAHGSILNWAAKSSSLKISRRESRASTGSVERTATTPKSSLTFTVFPTSYSGYSRVGTSRSSETSEMMVSVSILTRTTPSHDSSSLTSSAARST